MPRRASRVHRLTNGRFYADFRDYVDVLDGLSGRHIALVPEGERYATTNPDVAQALATELVRTFDDRRRTKALTGRAGQRWTLSTFAAHHLQLKRQNGTAGSYLLEYMRTAAIPRIEQFFGSDLALQDMRVSDVRAFVTALMNGQLTGKPLSGQTARNHLNVLSNLYRRAQEEEVVPQGFNPVAALMDKPHGNDEEAVWLEVHHAALLLHVVPTLPPVTNTATFLAPLLATYLLTGGRKREVLGLEMRDLHWDRGLVFFRPNQWRGLKSRRARRVVPIWPQLRELLEPYYLERARTVDPGSDHLLFPTHSRTGREAMVTDFRKAFAQLLEACPEVGPEVTTHTLRHTYCAARLQTTDHDRPISPYTVQIELGHTDDSLIMEIYGHLGEVRHRSDVVEYRIEQHYGRFPERFGKNFGQGTSEALTENAITESPVSI